jgi:hypothetical protein
VSGRKIVATVALTSHEPTCADEAIAPREHLTAQLRHRTATGDDLLLQPFDLVVDELHQVREAVRQRAEDPGDERFAVRRRILVELAGQLPEGSAVRLASTSSSLDVRWRGFVPHSLRFAPGQATTTGPPSAASQARVAA